MDNHCSPGNGFTFEQIRVIRVVGKFEKIPRSFHSLPLTSFHRGPKMAYKSHLKANRGSSLYPPNSAWASPFAINFLLLSFRKKVTKEIARYKEISARAIIGFHYSRYPSLAEPSAAADYFCVTRLNSHDRRKAI